MNAAIVTIIVLLALVGVWIYIRKSKPIAAAVFKLQETYQLHTIFELQETIDTLLHSVSIDDAAVKELEAEILTHKAVLRVLYLHTAHLTNEEIVQRFKDLSL